MRNHINHPFLLLSVTAATAWLVGCGGSATAPLQNQATLVATTSSANVNTSGTTTLGTTGGSGTGSVTYTVTSGSCTVAGNTLTAPSAAGTCSVTATKAADSSYNATTSAAISLTISVPFSPLTVVQNQTDTQNSYVADNAPTNAATSLPGNNVTGSYAWNQGGDWWGGVGTDSVYKGIGAAAGSGAGVGVFVKGAGSTTWNIGDATSIVVGLGTNPECVGICKATIILKASDTCIATINSPMTILTSPVNTGTSATQVSGAVPTYSSNLTPANWTVSGCTTNTLAAFKALPLKEVHAQLLAANMNFAGSGLSPNGINLGAIKFQ
jgi:hypothetical protein